MLNSCTAFYITIIVLFEHVIFGWAETRFYHQFSLEIHFVLCMMHDCGVKIHITSYEYRNNRNNSARLDCFAEIFFHFPFA